MEIKPGDLLVAHPSQTHTDWQETVFVCTEHHAHGTVALCVNRRKHMRLEEIFAHNGYDVHLGRWVRWGGPVNPRALICLHSSEWSSTNTSQINHEVAMTSDTLMLEKIAMNNTPRHWIVTSGMAAWAPGQLAQEYELGAWMTAPWNSKIVYSTEPDRVYSRAIEWISTLAVQNFF